MSNASRKATDSRISGLITIQEAAAYLSISKWMVRQLTYQKKIPAVQIGRRVLIDRRDLDRFIEKEKVA